MGLAASEKELAERASRFLKAEMKRSDVTYEEMAKRLKEHGLTNRGFHSRQAEAGDVRSDVPTGSPCGPGNGRDTVGRPLANRSEFGC